MVEKQVTIKDGVMPYLEGGEGKTVVFFHGGYAIPQAYDGILEILAKSYHVIAPTHPGHGDAFSIPADWHIQRFIESYLQFLTSVCPHPDYFIGHSFGGTIALLLGAEYPKIPIITMDSPIFPIMITDNKLLLQALIDELTGIVKTKPTMEEIRNIAQSVSSVLKTISKHPEDIPYFYRHGSTLNVSNSISSVINPVSILWGELDSVIPVSDGEKLHIMLTNSSLKILPGRHHLYPITEPVYTAQLLVNLLSHL